MIAYLEGRVIKAEDDTILLLAGSVGYEVMLPAVVFQRINTFSPEETLSLYIYYHQTERQPKPVLIGFETEEEKAFFQLFISVAAIGPLKAVKAMTCPVGDIARAIEERDAGFLGKLKGIGKRTAEKIIAALNGKAGRFASLALETELSSRTSVERAGASMGEVAAQVVEVLVGQLGHRHQDASALVEKALIRKPTISTPEELFDEIYKEDDR